MNLDDGEVGLGVDDVPQEGGRLARIQVLVQRLLRGQH